MIFFKSVHPNIIGKQARFYAIWGLLVTIAPFFISCRKTPEENQASQTSESHADTSVIAFRIVVEKSQEDTVIASRNVGHCHDMRWIEVTINGTDLKPFISERFECSRRQGTIEDVPANTYGALTLRGMDVNGDKETTFYFGEYGHQFTVDPGIELMQSE